MKKETRNTKLFFIQLNCSHTCIEELTLYEKTAVTNNSKQISKFPCNKPDVCSAAMGHKHKNLKSEIIIPYSFSCIKLKNNEI